MDFEKIRSLRGLFYRKVSDAARKRGEPLVLPGFEIKKLRHIVEFPKVDDITKIDITYPLVEPFAYANIKWDPNSKEVIYRVVEPELTKEDRKLLNMIADALIELVDVELSAIRKAGTAINYLEVQVSKIFKEFGLVITPNQYVKIMYHIYKNFIGFNEIESFLEDPNIEDISCDGVDTPIYVIHRKFGSLKTNVAFTDANYLREFVIKLAERCGRYVSYAEPILDGTLPDGSRVAATLAGDVATRGPTFTIRKFSEKPLSPTEQMDLGTVSSDILAYYWYIVEHGASMLIVGGVATGKTSFLNTICMFIPPEAKIVSIEDTRELRIPNEHWVPSLAREGFGIPMPSGEKYGGVTLFDLLKESFRQNPDYVIVGETRGKEAYVMFQGMSSGHPSMSTFHAGSIDTVVKRLTTPPIDLSPTLIESLNVITIMVHAREKGKSARRIKEVVEIVSVDPRTEEVHTNIVFNWNPATDIFQKVNKSILIERLAVATGSTLEKALAEIEERKLIIDWVHAKNIKDYHEVTKIINTYYKEPKRLAEMMEKDAPGLAKHLIARQTEKVAVKVPVAVPLAAAKPLAPEPLVAPLAAIPVPVRIRVAKPAPSIVSEAEVPEAPIAPAEAPMEAPAEAPVAVPVPEKAAGRMLQRASLLGLLGMKLIEEK